MKLLSCLVAEERMDAINKYRILLIDDDEDDFVHIQDLLNEIGSLRYSLVWESTYTDGLKALQEQTFDACLLDYKLGEKTGIELLGESLGKEFACPVIFLTGLMDFDLDIKECKSVPQITL